MGNFCFTNGKLLKHRMGSLGILKSVPAELYEYSCGNEVKTVLISVVNWRNPTSVPAEATSISVETEEGLLKH
ncbi:hypothetical protein [Bacteroides pyogenes]|nr:hypothetical protein [Bacteroides pyogenes]MBB3894443.1 hypothetical protein [Bacteroides pyogenes]SUV32272.1 Uncharacterised protein [Bacteroides pyogenes]